MFRTKRYIIFLSLFLLANHLPAQNITGTWEGDLGEDEFLQLNIIQNGNKLCGYTWDYVKNNRSSYCKAYFEGHYYKKQGEWVLNGTSFFANSGGHFLMRIRLTNSFIGGKNILEGFATIRSVMISILSLGGADSVHLVKVAGRPQEILENMNDCFLEEKKTQDTIATAPIPVKPADTIAKMSPPPVTTNDSVLKPSPFKRKNNEQSHIEVDVKNITLNVYDNAVVDGDTVSIFYNGRLLLSHQRLSQKPIVINLELDENKTRHEIVLFAENLGSIPPNTALIVIYAGDKRYELFSSSSLEENAVLVFEYKPKKQ